MCNRARPLIQVEPDSQLPGAVFRDLDGVARGGGRRAPFLQSSSLSPLTTVEVPLRGTMQYLVARARNPPPILWTLNVVSRRRRCQSGVSGFLPCRRERVSGRARDARERAGGRGRGRTLSPAAIRFFKEPNAEKLLQIKTIPILEVIC